MRQWTRGAAVILLSLGLVLTTAAILSAHTVLGKPLDPPDGVYQVTVKKVEISSDDGNSYTTLKEADLNINIAAANAGAVAATYVTPSDILNLLDSGAIDPTKTYNRIRVRISCTIRLKGTVVHDGTTYYTTSAGGTSTSAADLAEGPYTVPSPPCSGGTLTDTTDSGEISFNFGSPVDVSFGVVDSIRLDHPLLFTLSPATPTVTYQQ